MSVDVRYMVVEVSPVDEQTLEEGVNAWTREGWMFERVEFVQQPAVRRPVLAYLFFFKGVEADAPGGDEAPGDLDGAEASGGDEAPDEGEGVTDP